MLGSQDFTNVIFSTTLDRFEKKVRTTVLGEFINFVGRSKFFHSTSRNSTITIIYEPRYKQIRQQLSVLRINLLH